MIVQIIFFTALFGATYSYFIYPIILMSITFFTKRNSHAETNETDILPNISFIITAFNEEKHIADKLENTLKIHYPSDKLEIIVASDGSTDNTNSITQSYSNQGIQLHHVATRKGKENAQRSAIEISKGDILVFSDVSTQIEEGALKQIAKIFQNPKVGAISSEDRFITAEGDIAGEGAYVKYEMWLRKLEGKVNSLVGLSGSFFAARKEICSNWNINVPSDFNTALNCIRKDYIAISDPKLLGYYPNLKDETKEYQRKVRTVIRGISALFSQSAVLNPFKFGFFSFQIFSHKLMRWLVPWFLIVALISNILLLTSGLFYTLLFALQIAFYLLAFLGWSSKSLRQSALTKIPYFFIQVNLAIADATLQYLFGKRVTLWEPSKR